MPNKLEQRIRARAHRLWEEEGRPEGRAHVHWEQARTLVAIEDDKTSLKPAEPPAAEPAEVMQNLGEFPTAMTDGGDRQPFPSTRRAAAGKSAAAKPESSKPESSKSGSAKPESATVRKITNRTPRKPRARSSG